MTSARECRRKIFTSIIVNERKAAIQMYRGGYTRGFSTLSSSSITKTSNLSLRSHLAAF